MQYQVPQFIEVEDKIFGPLTARQFIYLAGGGGVTLALLSILPLIIALIVATPIVALAGALAFYQVNGRPFLSAMENAFNFFVRKKLYLWNAQHTKRTSSKVPASVVPTMGSLVPKVSESKLRDLSWSLNIKDRQLMGERPNPVTEQFKI